MTAVGSITEDINAFAIATHFTKRAHTSVTLTRSTRGTFVEAFTTMLVVAAERNTLLRVIFATELLVVGADALTIQTYTGATTFFTTDTAVIRVRLSIDALITAGGLAT